jgi:lysophospholipase L1-like esterase
VVLASATVALIPAELIARRALAAAFQSVLDPYEHHPYRPFARYRDEHGTVVVTNELGWKDAAPRPVDRKPRQPRVVLLGDSFTEGLGLPYEETVGAYVDAALEHRGAEHEVLNGGRVSFCPLLSYQRLKRFLAAGYRTDVVVLLPDVSDVQDGLGYREQFDFDASGEPLRLRGVPGNAAVRAVYNHLALSRAGWRVTQRLFGNAPAHLPPRVLTAEDRQRGLDAIAAAGSSISTDELRELPPAAHAMLRSNWMIHAPSREGWAREGLDLLSADVRRIASLCDREGIPLIVVLYPVPQMLYSNQDDDLYRLQVARFDHWLADREAIAGRAPASLPTAYEEAVLGCCPGSDVRFVDLVPVLAARSDWPLLYQRGDVHFTAAGNQALGEAIAAAIGATR